ncbi:AT-hook motif nuclear-localized protein 28-like [Cicer arietinum]|uniref:AT-hook motif nuclear-localized protein 28-like n=1 Tax=Cicer arietinum TaxID=3827 RepID=A0A1S2XP23_CICAR|nr:AT-hook motif nuclear-localized protein 28-like [Cicer arietinum]
MTQNEETPSSYSPNSKNESLENKALEFSAPSLANNNENLTMETPPSSRPSSSSVKRPRGRPRGSKNKPKPPVVINIDPSETSMKPILIEIPAGNDVVESLINMAWRHQADISVLRGFGMVSNITLCNPISHSPAFTYQGPFQMISLCGTYVNPNCGRVPSQFITHPACSSFTIYLSGGRGGQVFGGVVGGKVMAAEVVSITATLFKKPKFYRVVTTNGGIKEVAEDETRHVDNNNNVIMSGYSANSSHMNPPSDVNFMHWNHSTRTNNY